MAAIEHKLGVGEYFGEAVRRRSAFGFVLTENHFQPNVDIPLHRHELPHFTCILAGGFVETYDDLRLECRQGTILIVPANREHSDLVTASGAHTLSIEVSPQTHKRIRETSDVLDSPALLSDKVTSRLVDRIYGEFRSQDTASLLLLASLSLELIGTAERLSEKSDGPSWMPKAMTLLHTLDPGMSLGKLAVEVGINEAHLARTFRRVNGCSVGEYLKYLKLEQAKSNLTQSKLNLSEIAIEAGFYDQAHFSREFKKAFGSTPSLYRKLRK